MLTRILAAAVIVAALPTAVWGQAQKADVRGATPASVHDQFKIAFKLTTVPPGPVPPPVIKELQDMLLGVGCPDWTGDEGTWGTSSAAQFTEFLRKTGQAKIYDAMRQPSVGEIRDKLFSAWEQNSTFSEAIRSDPKYCEPYGRSVLIKADLRENHWTTRNILLPDGVPEAIAKDLQQLMENVGCPNWAREDGKWGPNTASQFSAFLRATNQDRDYEQLAHGAPIVSIRELFKDWASEVDFTPNDYSDPEYCYPRPSGGEDEDKNLKVGVDLRAPQPNSKLPSYVARSVQQLLKLVGCPDWGGVDGKWGPSSASQFERFLQKTGQIQQYEVAKGTTLWDVKQHFSGWIARSDFEPKRNDKPQYCEPIARCDLNATIEKILSAKENFALRELFQKLHAWNVDRPRQKNIQGRSVTPQEEEALGVARERLGDAEAALRALLLHTAESQYPTTCGLCELKSNYEHALFLGLKNVTEKVLREYRLVWSEASAVKRSIINRQELLLQKQRAVLASQALKLSKAQDVSTIENIITEEDPGVVKLKGMLQDENFYLEDKLLGPIRRSIAAESGRELVLRHKAFRREMELTRCFVGDGIYVPKQSAP